MPDYSFTERLQAVLIDGQHAFPFPQLEYFYLYPRLEENGLLILDDIHIHTIQELYRFIRADEMFELTGVVERTAFFRRTAAPVFNPMGDGWSLQRYNRNRLFRYVWRESLMQAVPEHLRRFLRTLPARIFNPGPVHLVWIDAPKATETVGPTAVARGRAKVPLDGYLWLFARRADLNGWWPQGSGPLTLAGDQWEQTCKFGEDADDGQKFNIAAVITDDQGNRRVLRWFLECSRSKCWGPMPLPNALQGAMIATTEVTRGASAQR
ncbi:MAG: hypothetical protein ACR2NN_22165 [Bryobacteraceae bacterium]